MHSHQRCTSTPHQLIGKAVKPSRRVTSGFILSFYHHKRCLRMCSAALNRGFVHHRNNTITGVYVRERERETCVWAALTRDGWDEKFPSETQGKFRTDVSTSPSCPGNTNRLETVKLALLRSVFYISHISLLWVGFCECLKNWLKCKLK